VARILKLLLNKSITPEKTVFYLDQAPLHRTPEVLQAFKLAGVGFFYAPPYSSPLMPCEQIFSLLKNFLAKREAETKVSSK